MFDEAPRAYAQIPFSNPWLKKDLNSKNIGYADPETSSPGLQGGAPRLAQKFHASRLSFGGLLRNTHLILPLGGMGLRRGSRDSTIHEDRHTICCGFNRSISTTSAQARGGTVLLLLRGRATVNHPTFRPRFLRATVRLSGKTGAKRF